MFVGVADMVGLQLTLATVWFGVFIDDSSPGQARIGRRGGHWRRRIGQASRYASAYWSAQASWLACSLALLLIGINKSAVWLVVRWRRVWLGVFVGVAVWSAIFVGVAVLVNDEAAGLKYTSACSSGVGCLMIGVFNRRSCRSWLVCSLAWPSIAWGIRWYWCAWACSLEGARIWPKTGQDVRRLARY